MKKAYVYLAEGFEVTEALGTADVMIRGGLTVKTVSISDSREVTSSNGTTVIADLLLKDAKTDVDAIVLPGGMPGTLNLEKCEALTDIIKKRHHKGKLITAICAAPSILGHLGILNGVTATCYPGFEKDLTGATISDAKVVKDGNIITGKGMGASFDFGLMIVETLMGKEAAERVITSAIIK